MREGHPSRFPAIAILAAGLLCGCASHSPIWQGDRAIVISGKMTAGMSPQDALQLFLEKAARLTVGHGFRYFVLATPLSPDRSGLRNAEVRPGADITIKLFRDGEIKYPAPSVWDAFLVLEQRKTVSTTR